MAAQPSSIDRGRKLLQWIIDRNKLHYEGSSEGFPTLTLCRQGIHSTAPQAKRKKGSHSPDPKARVHVEYSPSSSIPSILTPEDKTTNPRRLNFFSSIFSI
ncbi:hypothetical protein QWA68_009812 [Fusarium oxysporum]|nr:hypothetical protein QWA68_009812 [Fusarium oxysporum]